MTSSSTKALANVLAKEACKCRQCGARKSNAGVIRKNSSGVLRQGKFLALEAKAAKSIWPLILITSQLFSRCAELT